MSTDSATPAPSDAARLAARAFGLDPDALESLGGYESEVVVGTSPEGPVVLKVMDPGHRSPSEAHAEIDWLLAMRAAGIRVAEPLHTLDGAYVEVFGDPSRLAVAYRRAPGRHLPAKAWTSDALRAYGSLLGRMQVHARGWSLPAGRSRPTWREWHSVLHELTGPLADDAPFRAAVDEVTARVRSAVPTPEAHVGLIHNDLHRGNVLVDDDGRLTAIDFDDMVLGPYLWDLAIPLYYAVAMPEHDDPGAAADAFLGPFLAGFDAVAPRPPGGGDAVAALLALRQAELVVAVNRDIPAERLSDDIREFGERLRARTVERTEVVPIDVLRAHFGGS